MWIRPLTAGSVAHPLCASPVLGAWWSRFGTAGGYGRVEGADPFADAFVQTHPSSHRDQRVLPDSVVVSPLTRRLAERTENHTQMTNTAKRTAPTTVRRRGPTRERITRNGSHMQSGRQRGRRGHRRWGESVSDIRVRRSRPTSSCPMTIGSVHVQARVGGGRGSRIPPPEAVVRKTSWTPTRRCASPVTTRSPRSALLPGYSADDRLR